MCGIVAILNEAQQGLVHPEFLQTMTRFQHHRGPDEEGVWISKDRAVGLGHTRLSIIDLSSGQQPMQDRESGCAISFNGEIYNYQTIRNELKTYGHPFHTTSDTEVLLRAYLHWGSQVLTKLKGIFAFVLYDPRCHQAFLARDPIGVKPLYWTFDKKTLLVASEFRTLAVHRQADPEWSFQGLVEYFSIGYNLAPTTLLKDIYQLPHGHYAIWKKGKLSEHRYFDLADAISCQTKKSSDRPHQISCLIEKAVQEQMIADVPVGSFLSGGTDSSLVTFYAARSKKSQNFPCAILHRYV